MWILKVFQITQFYFHSSDWKIVLFVIADLKSILVVWDLENNFPKNYLPIFYFSESERTNRIQYLYLNETNLSWFRTIPSYQHYGKVKIPGSISWEIYEYFKMIPKNRITASKNKKLPRYHMQSNLPQMESQYVKRGPTKEGRNKLSVNGRFPLLGVFIYKKVIP